MKEVANLDPATVGSDYHSDMNFNGLCLAGAEGLEPSTLGFGGVGSLASLNGLGPKKRKTCRANINGLDPKVANLPATGNGWRR